MPTLKSIACADVAMVSAPSSAIAPACCRIVLSFGNFLLAMSRMSRASVMVWVIRGSRREKSKPGKPHGRETARQGRDRERRRLRRAGLGQRPRHGGDLRAGGRK